MSKNTMPLIGNAPALSFEPTNPVQRYARVLSEIARHGCVYDTEVILDRDPTYSDAYGDLSAKLWTEFVIKAKSLDDSYVALASLSSIQLGFNVLGKILYYAPLAYAEYCKKNNCQLDVKQLGEILHRSKSILELFANRDNSSNVTIETAFGLRKIKPYYANIPFIIGPNKEGLICFLPETITLRGAHNEIYTQGRVKDPSARCPAYGYVLNSIWDAAVDRCVEEPQLFSSSLGLNK